MVFARKVWKLLVAIKDGLALIFLLLFFLALYAVLTARPGADTVHEGALLLELDGTIVEERSVTDPLALLLSGSSPMGEHSVHDVVRALRLAAKDDRINSVAIDLSSFVGGGQVHLQDIGSAMDEVRAAKKPVLVYAIAYLDDGLQLAAHADEAWVDPNGGAFATGPGGNQLYFASLMEKLNVNVHIFRVGTFKSAVEPWSRDGPSDASLESLGDLYGAMWRAWKADVRKARPKADIDFATEDPVAWLKSAGGDAPRAAMKAGLIDKIGTWTDFGMRVAEVSGSEDEKRAPGSFTHTELSDWLRANPPAKNGKAIGVVTIAGEIVDGDAGPGVAGGDRIVDVLNEGLDDELAALVVRVDSPGGSVMASQRIREAIARYKERKIPVVVSMANVAASGGYWVSTPADRIFAEPATITGSIGIFAVLPTFEKALAEFGVTGGGVKTTPLSGQPDVFTGLAPEIPPMIQATVEHGYGQFTSLVSKSRGIPLDTAQDWAEGRPWDGGTARQLRLVDGFGGLDEALAYAAKRAGLEDSKWHARFLGEKGDAFSAFISRLEGENSRAGTGTDLAGIAAYRQNELLAQVRGQVHRLFSIRGAQAYCLECSGVPSHHDPGAGADEVGLLTWVAALGAR